MANVSQVGGVPDDVFISRAEQAAQLAEDAQAAAEAAQAAAEAALAATLAALAAQEIEDHADTTIVGKTTLDILRWNGAAWVNAQVPVGDLSDVSTGGAADGDILSRTGGVYTTTPIGNVALPIGGGTLTGFLTLNADPTAALHAATKQYVDASSGGSIYDIGFFFNGIPAANEDRRFVASRAFFIPGTANNSQAISRVATTGAYSIDIQRNGASIGTISWGAAATVATITITSASNENFAQGDVLSLVASGTPDATVDDINVTIAGTLGTG